MTSILRGTSWENLNERNHAQNVGVHWKMTLKLFVNKQREKM